MHISFLHVWQLPGQDTHEELIKESPGAQEVHSVMLFALQLEQASAHPLQVPCTLTNP